MRYFIIFLICLSSVIGNAQQLQVTELYEFDMKYIGSSTSVDPNYQYVLMHLVELMKKNEDWKLHIRGHVCCGPDDKIGQKRAKNVYKLLLKLGVDEARMTYKGYSDSIPIVFPEKTEEDAQKNRRVDFLITKTVNE